MPPSPGTAPGHTVRIMDTMRAKSGEFRHGHLTAAHRRAMVVIERIHRRPHRWPATHSPPALFFANPSPTFILMLSARRSGSRPPSKPSGAASSTETEVPARGLPWVGPLLLRAHRPLPEKITYQPVVNGRPMVNNSLIAVRIFSESGSQQCPSTSSTVRPGSRIYR